MFLQGEPNAKKELNLFHSERSEPGWTDTTSSVGPHYCFPGWRGGVQGLPKT